MKKISIILCVLFASISSVYATENVILGGDSIGIVVNYEGVLVNGFYDIKQNDQTYNNKDILEINDIIIEVNNEPVTNIIQFQEGLRNYTINDKVAITYIRDDRLMHSEMICLSESSYSCGLYLKDSVNGIGTITYYNIEEESYAALAHYVSSDNNEYLQSGTVYEAPIYSVNEASKNVIGSKKGSIDYEQEIGSIELNSNYGLYGDIKDTIEGTLIETQDKEYITLSNASLYTVIDGENIEEFSITITEISEDSFCFTVDDERLLDTCGGIIQGMSGSPIVQDGKLIGAVSHVVVSDPSRGNGIFIENMLETAESIEN